MVWLIMLFHATDLSPLWAIEPYRQLINEAFREYPQTAYSLFLLNWLAVFSGVPLRFCEN